MFKELKLYFQESVEPLPELKVKQEPGLCLSEALSTVTTTTITTTSVSSVVTATTTATTTTVTPTEIKTDIKPDMIKQEFMKQDMLKQDIIKHDFIKQEIIKQDLIKQDFIKQEMESDNKLNLSDIKSTTIKSDVKDESLTLPQGKEDPVAETTSPESTGCGNTENINGGESKASPLGPLAQTTSGSGTPPKSKKGNISDLFFYFYSHL